MPLPSIALSDAPGRIAALTRGQILTLIDVDPASLRGALETAATRQILILDVTGADSLVGMIEQVIDELADLALARWPDWYPGATLEPATLPNVLQPWRRAASRLAAARHRPRFRRTPRQTEFAQLLLAIEPGGLVLLAALDPASTPQAALMVDALAWCARQGAAIVVVSRTQPPFEAPFQRILYGALRIASPPAPVISRLILPSGRAHHASATEKRVEAALRLDPELGPLFERNVLASIAGPGAAPRVDLLWREGRIVVELDGPEHCREPNYGRDRHRDYELLMAGYAVLRLTNAEVETDLACAIEKIRNVVRLRGTGAGP